MNLLLLTVFFFNLSKCFDAQCSVNLKTQTYTDAYTDAHSKCTFHLLSTCPATSISLTTLCRRI